MAAASGVIRSVGLSHHPLQGVLGGALVRQPGQRVVVGPELGQREVAQVAQHRRRLGHRVPDPELVIGRQRILVRDQHRSDDLPAHQQRLADRAGSGTAQSAQLSSGVRAGSSRCVRPMRSARQARGSAPGSRATSGLPGANAVAASSRFSLLLRLSTATVLPGRLRSRCRCTSSCASLLARGHLQRVGELQLVGLPTADRVGPADHVVQRAAQVRQLVAAARVQASDRAPRGDVGGEARVRAQARHQVPDQQKHHGERDQQGGDRADDQLPPGRVVAAARLLRRPLGLSVLVVAHRPGLGRHPVEGGGHPGDHRGPLGRSDRGRPDTAAQRQVLVEVMAHRGRNCRRGRRSVRRPVRWPAAAVRRRRGSRRATARPARRRRSRSARPAPGCVAGRAGGTRAGCP